MSGNRSLIEEREQQLAEARALRQGYQQSGTFHAEGTRGGRSKPRAPGRRAPQAGSQSRGGMRTTSRMTAGNNMYIGSGAQRHSAQISAAGYRPPSTGYRNAEHHTAQAAHRATVVTARGDTLQPKSRVVSYYQDNDNNTSAITSTTGATIAHPTVIPTVAAPAADTPVDSQAPAQSNSTYDWNTAQPATDADAFNFDSGFGSRPGSVTTIATGQPFLTPAGPVTVTTTAPPSVTPSLPVAVTNNNTLSAGQPAPNTIWHWNYQDVTAGPEIIPVELGAADAMDIDSYTPSPPENSEIWVRPTKNRIPCTCSARGLVHSRWAEPSLSTPVPPNQGRFPYEPKFGMSGGLCPLHGNKNDSKSSDGHGSASTAGNDDGGNYY